MLQSRFVFADIHREIWQVFFRFSSILLITVLFCGLNAPGQEPVEAPTPVPTPTPGGTRNSPGTFTADQIAESSIFIYGGGGGRGVLDQIRKTTFERGRTHALNAEGRMANANYQRWIIRGETSTKDRIRLEQDFPTARFSLVSNGEQVFGIFNDRRFSPREDASKAFENQNLRSIDALLRFKENESAIALSEPERIMGVDYYVVDLTDKAGRMTRYYVSQRTFRVMMLEYEEAGVKYKRRFYDYRYAQNTLVPFRTVLWADDSIIEETHIGTITFGQKVDEGLFIAS